MNRMYRFSAVLLMLLVVIISCQKELDDSRDPNSQGVLAKDSAGNCSLITVAGRYIQGRLLTDSNKLIVKVNVTTPGNYTIGTDTINGYFFRTTGRFSTTGQQTVALAATGRPMSVALNQFTVFYNTSSCRASITVQPAIPAAVFTLTGAPGGCTNAVLSGSFTRGVLLDSSSYVSISVNVTTTGSYSLTTPIMNGYFFSGAGVLNSVGVQSIRLYASGLLVAAGNDTFPITANNNTCRFVVPVALPAPVADYFPITTNSYWVYDNLFSTADSVKRMVTDSVVANGSLYKQMQEQRLVGTRQLLFRKAAGDYIEYSKVDKFTNSVIYATPSFDDFIFLKNSATTGTTWQSPEYSGTATFGQLIFIRYNYTCEDANATVTVNGRTFNNVKKMLMYPEIKSQGNMWGSTSEYYFSWYAKDIGLIYERKLNNNFTVYELALKRWQIY